MIWSNLPFFLALDYCKHGQDNPFCLVPSRADRKRSSKGCEFSQERVLTLTMLSLKWNKHLTFGFGIKGFEILEHVRRVTYCPRTGLVRRLYWRPIFGCLRIGSGVAEVSRINIDRASRLINAYEHRLDPNPLKSLESAWHEAFTEDPFLNVPGLKVRISDLIHFYRWRHRFRLEKREPGVQTQVEGQVLCRIRSCRGNCKQASFLNYLVHISAEEKLSYRVQLANVKYFTGLQNTKTCSWGWQTIWKKNLRIFLRALLRLSNWFLGLILKRKLIYFHRNIFKEKFGKKIKITNLLAES